MMKKCSKCKCDKTDKEFCKAKHTKSKLQSWCNRCVADKMKIRRKEQSKQRLYDDMDKWAMTCIRIVSADVSADVSTNMSPKSSGFEKKAL